MLVIDETKLKLLRMKEKLLEVSVYGRDQVLSQYKEIVLDIDKDMYNSLIDMIKNANYHNLPLEEQLVFLTNIENEYNGFNEFQCKYQDIYEKYAGDKLELSPIEDIYIDKVKERISAINGYLVNKQNLDKYRNKIEKLNVQLISSEKRKNEIEERFSLLESELKTNVLNAEGRIDNQGNLEYTSIQKEFEQHNLDLKKLLNDNDLLEQELAGAGSALSSAEDKMDAAKVCFNNLPNIETKKLYNVSYYDALNAHYRLILLNFAYLIANEHTNYEDVRDKRFKLQSLIKERAKLVNDLRIKFVIDPFERIKLNEQMEIIELLGKNLQGVFQVKEEIKLTFNLVDEINTKNKELYAVISNNDELFRNRDVIVSAVGEVQPLVDDNQIEQSKVIDIRDVSSKINLNLVHKRTKGVIVRVYELFNTVPEPPKNEEVVPELVIQRDSIFSDENSSQDIFKNDNIFIDESHSQGIFNDDKVQDNLFSEIEPFQQTILFADKYDDVFAKDTVKEKGKDEEMPELFFDTEQAVFDNNEEEEETQHDNLSIDEQVKALKLVA